jgi:hypothetical protein
VHSFDSVGIDRAIMVAKVSLHAPVEKEQILTPLPSPKSKGAGFVKPAPFDFGPF